MSWREDLALFGINVPANLSVDELVAPLKAKPCQNALAVVGLAAVLFYVAEKDHNPKVTTIWDATVYCSTCLSVGYGDIFARTPIGKIVGTLLMTIGPALANKTLDGTGTEGRDNRQEQILVVLKDILAELQSRRALQVPGFPVV